MIAKQPLFISLTEKQRGTLAALEQAGGKHRWVPAKEVAALLGVSANTVAQSYACITIRARRTGGAVGGGYRLERMQGKGARLIPV